MPQGDGTGPRGEGPGTGGGGGSCGGGKGSGGRRRSGGGDRGGKGTGGRRGRGGGGGGRTGRGDAAPDEQLGAAGAGMKRGDTGASDECICPRCGVIVPHHPGKPCSDESCPACGEPMERNR